MFFTCFATCLTPYPATATAIDVTTPTPGITETTPCPKSTNPLTTFPCANYLTARTPLIAKPTIGRPLKIFLPINPAPSSANYLAACFTMI